MIPLHKDLGVLADGVWGDRGPRNDPNEVEFESRADLTSGGSPGSRL